MPNYDETLERARNQAINQLANCETRLATSQPRDKSALTREINVLRSELTSLSRNDW